MTEVKHKEEEKEMEEYNGDDFVLYKKGGKIISGGFDINSILMSQGLPTITTYNRPNNYNGSKVSDLFKNLVVPSGLYYMNMKTYPDKYGYKYAFDNGDDETNIVIVNNEEPEDDVINDDIFEKLLSIASVDDKQINKKKRGTRRSHTEKKNKTRKAKN